jgi:hypothetical protein
MIKAIIIDDEQPCIDAKKVYYQSYGLRFDIVISIESICMFSIL